MLISQPILTVNFGRLEDKKFLHFFVIEFIMATNQPCDINQQVISIHTPDNTLCFKAS